MSAAISLEDVVKTFNEHRAVNGITFEVPEGTIFGLLGPNGAGKSTTIRMVMDIFRPDAGTIRVLGAEPSTSVRGRVGYLPEERGLYRKMKVLEALEFLGTLKGASIADARREATQWLDRLGLGDWRAKKVEELSKGMQQKAQLIAAMMGRPRLMILDEPFSGMDPVNQNLFKDLILESNREGATVVFSTHQMETAEKLCNEIVLIHRGEVVLSGTLGAVKGRFGTNAVQLEFEGDGSFLNSFPGVFSVDAYGHYHEVRLEPGTDPQRLLQVCADRLKVRRFEVVAPTLHNIFLEQVKDAVEPKMLREAHA